MNLKQGKNGETYVIDHIKIKNSELSAFLFSLGCYSGEKITVVRQLRNGCIVNIKDGKYHIDTPLAEAIAI